LTQDFPRGGAPVKEHKAAASAQELFEVYCCMSRHDARPQLLRVQGAKHGREDDETEESGDIEDLSSSHAEFGSKRIKGTHAVSSSLSAQVIGCLASKPHLSVTFVVQNMDESVVMIGVVSDVREYALNVDLPCHARGLAKLINISPHFSAALASAAEAVRLSLRVEHLKFTSSHAILRPCVCASRYFESFRSSTLAHKTS
jgi:hypothetical protein